MIAFCFSDILCDFVRQFDNLYYFCDFSVLLFYFVCIINGEYCFAKMNGGKLKSMSTIEKINELIESLELNVPDVYVKCIISLPDKKGTVKEKKCILNLATGDVMKARKIQPHEAVNHRIVRSYDSNYSSGISHFSFQNAQILDDKVVLATWIFGDYMNQPGTAQLETTYYDHVDIDLDSAPMGNKVHPDALANVYMSKPKVAAIVTVSADKTVEMWEDVKKYGLQPLKNCHRSLNPSEYLTNSLGNTLYSAYDTRRVVGLVESFKNLFEVGYVGANKYLTFDSYKEVSVFMKAAPMQMKNNQYQQKVNELTSIPLPDHTIVPMTEKTICYADRVNDEWTVLRWHVRSKTARYVETTRIYVNKTEALHCRSDLNGNWIHAATKIKALTFNADRVILQYPCVLDGTKLEYFKNISADMSIQSAALYMLTMYPEFEKMYKIGLDWLCDWYIKGTYQMSWKNFLEEYIGHMDWNATNIYKVVGINRHQIESIDSFVKKLVSECQVSSYGYWQERNVRAIIQKMKCIFHVDALNSIDDESFDYILNSITIERLMSVYTNGLATTFQIYGNEAMYFIKDLNAIDNGDDYVITVQNQYGYVSRMNVDRLYYDTMSMIESGEYMDVLRPRFSTIEELVGHHQVMIDLINAENMEHEARANRRYESGFETNHKRWERWEWDGDTFEFCVVAPSKPLDVAAEGIALRHCVKSYIPSVSQGKTNIMFIRRKGKETEPFFTVEVDSYNQIRQVHGFCNCNVSSVAGLHEFVTKWSKLKKLKYNGTTARQVRAVGT
jgi:hypothetical protein